MTTTATAGTFSTNLSILNPIRTGVFANLKRLGGGGGGQNGPS